MICLKKSAFVKKLYETKDKKKNNDLVYVIKSRLSDLKNKIKDMNEEEKEVEKLNVIIDLVEEILEFNKQQHGLGLKILTPNQTLSRLPISLPQLNAGNNSEKLKNKIRQLLYSLTDQKNLQNNFIKV